MNTILSLFGVALLSLLLVETAFGHSYLTNPISRSNQKQSNAGCRGPACLGPCDIPLASATRAPISIQRGATINPQWPRNNHAGGFIRFAWAPTAQSDNAASFDAGVESIFCHEIGGCGPSNPSDPNGGDTGPADGSVNPCQTTITVPLSLPNGLYTLQWAWFGGAFALGDYYSCVDYQITGGPTGNAVAAVYHGGDYSNPNANVCKFFNTDRLHVCVNEPCNNPIYPASVQETGPAFGFSSASSSSSSSSSTSTSTTHAPATPLTTGAAHASPVSTPMTTGAVHAPSPVSTPMTTGHHSSSTTTTTTSHSSGSSSSNCAGVSVASQSHATIVSVDTWTGGFLATVNIVVQESVLPNWYLNIQWSQSTTVTAVYNGGVLQCQSGSMNSVIKPSASWAKNLPMGSLITIQVLGSCDVHLDSQSIIANTQLSVFTS